MDSREYAQQLLSIPKEGPLVIFLDDFNWGTAKVDELTAGKLNKENKFVSYTSGEMPSDDDFDTLGHIPFIADRSPDILMDEIAADRASKGQKTILLQDFDISGFDTEVIVIDLLHDLRTKYGVIEAVVSQRAESAFFAILNAEGQVPLIPVYSRITGELFVPENLDDEFQDELEVYMRFPKNIQAFIDVNLGVESL